VSAVAAHQQARPAQPENVDDEFQGQVIDLSKRKELPCNLDEMATRARSQSYALLKTPTSNEQPRISNGELRH
jgi:hypothetical protein